MVLLIDDDPIVSEALCHMLDSEEDINHHYCSNPLTAISTAETVKPTVILLDMIMPEVDGITVLRYLRANKRTRDIPVVVLSAKEEPERKARVFAAGGNDYLIKLPEKIELLARIRYHSQSYMTLLQRDEAFRALRASQKKLSEINFKLEQLASSDGLTGLANRRHFDETFEVEWRRAVRIKGWLSLILFDIDFFKKCNDCYGHQAGDDVLKKVAGAIKDSSHRASDLAARYGGEEFVVLLPGTDPEGAGSLAEKIRKNVEALGIEHRDSPVSPVITISGGIASATADIDTARESLISAADQALYRAKEGGRNRVVVSTDVKVGG